MVNTEDTPTRASWVRFLYSQKEKRQLLYSQAALADWKGEKPWRESRAALGEQRTEGGPRG